MYKLSPTLSYTQTLENRIRELEKLVGNTQIQYPSANHLPRPTTPTLSAPFKGLKVDECGAITYHGATSFFNLPNASTSLADEASVKATWGKSMSIDEGERRKEKLVHNAWQQRALEAFSETPVCRTAPVFTCTISLTIAPFIGALPIHAANPLVLDSATIQLCVSTCFYKCVSHTCAIFFLYSNTRTSNNRPNRRHGNTWPVLLTYSSQCPTFPLRPLV